MRPQAVTKDIDRSSPASWLRPDVGFGSMLFLATVAAVAFAGMLVVLMRSDEVRGILTDLVRRALTVS